MSEQDAASCHLSHVSTPLTPRSQGVREKEQLMAEWPKCQADTRSVSGSGVPQKCGVLWS